MKDKCSKYESLFVFRSEEELNEHIRTCEDCRHEHEKMLRVSELIQEAKPYFVYKQKLSYTKMKVACIMCLGLFAGTLIGYFTQFNYYISANNYSSEYSTQTTNEYGMPVDNYGLITVN